MRVAEYDSRADLRGARTEHHDARAHVAQRVQRALDDGTPADPRELLGPAEAPSGAGGEDDAADGQRASSISAASASSDAIELPGSRWSTCGSAARMPRVNGS